jgi:hypothetical protein
MNNTIQAGQTIAKLREALNARSIRVNRAIRRGLSDIHYNALRADLEVVLAEVRAKKPATWSDH